MHRFLISAAHKSSGKTTLSIGLAAALRQRRLSAERFWLMKHGESRRIAP